MLVSAFRSFTTFSSDGKILCTFTMMPNMSANALLLLRHDHDVLIGFVCSLHCRALPGWKSSLDSAPYGGSVG